MLLRAIHRIKGNGAYTEPGEIITVSDNDGKRLLRLGAAEAVRKVVSVNLPSNNSKIKGQGADGLRELGQKINQGRSHVGRLPESNGDE